MIGARGKGEMRKWPWLLAFGVAGIALPGCTTMGTAEDTETALASISYETGPCFGACPVFVVTVESSGHGTFEGRRFTQLIGRRDFEVTDEQFRRFEQHLAPIRPAIGAVHYAGEKCAMLATDLPSADVHWTSRNGNEQSLYFYYGCDMEANREIAERLRQAPYLLPIAGFIKTAE